MTTSISANDSLILEMLVQSVACGDDGLREELEAQAPIIWCMTKDCREDQHYLQAQLGIVDFAMLYARNQIDLANSRENSIGESVSTASGERDTEGTRNSAYNKCGWSEVTSWQQFERNSAQHDRARSDSTSTSDAASHATSWDRGTQASQGWSTSFDDALSTSDAEATTTARSSDVRNSQSSSGTPAWKGDGNVDPGSDVNINFEKPAFHIELIPFSFDVEPGSLTLDDPVDDDYVNPGPHLPFCGDENDPCEPLASYGRGWSANYSLTFAIPSISVTVNWGSGGSFRQSFICSSGQTSGTGISWSEANATATDESQSDGAATGHDENSTRHDAHRRADSYSDSDSEGSASARGIMRSLGETDSGADSASHSEQYSTGTSAQSGTSWSESNASSYDDTTGTSDAHYWSQIFTSLNDMWQRIFYEAKLNDDIYHASAPALSGLLGAMITAPCCDGKIPSYMTTRPRPVRPSMPMRRSGCSTAACATGVLR